MGGHNDGILRRVLRIRSVRRDLEEELAFHFAETVEELMSEGMSREEAAAETRRRFGDEARYRRQLESIDRAAQARRKWRGRADGAREAARFAGRGIRRSPGLSIGIVLAFALGIGANAMMFGTVDRLLLSPPDHVVEPDAVKRLFIDRFIPFIGERRAQGSFTYPDLMELRAASAFSGLAMYSGNNKLTVGAGPDARQVEATFVTGNFWNVLGVKPAFGRFFTEAEDVRGGEPVVVIGHGHWQREYGGGRDVLGRTIDFGHGPYTIVGVAPAGFTGAELTSVDLWLPLHIAGVHQSGDLWLEHRQWWWLRGVVRLADGASAERAQTEASAIYRNSRREFIDQGQEAEDRSSCRPH